MKKRYSNFFEKLICMGAVILAVIPLLFVAGKSVQVPEEYLILLFKRPLYLRMMWNSLIITIPVLIGQLLLAPLAAYGFWQCRWKYKEILFYLYMIVMLMPLQLTLVPNYLVANWLGIQNSSLAIILPAMFQPLGVFLIRQQIQDFPQETLEAARLDGASEYRIYRSIVKPNLSSAIAAALILIFIDIEICSLMFYTISAAVIRVSLPDFRGTAGYLLCSVRFLRSTSFIDILNGTGLFDTGNQYVRCESVEGKKVR